MEINMLHTRTLERLIWDRSFLSIFIYYLPLCFKVYFVQTNTTYA